MANLDDLCGRMLGEFVLRERLDEGGFGAVYRCDQPLLGREAVVKVLHRGLRRQDVALKRFMREAQLASRLDHPYAAHVYAFGIEEGDELLWIAMEMVQGITLNRWLQTRGPMPLDEFVPFFERVAEVVQAAHDCGIVHRDLKPSNVMVIERAGRLLPKLLDFGVAKLLNEVAASDPARWPDPPPAADEPGQDDGERTPRMRATAPPRRGQHRLTRADAAIGSPPYMSPEQWNDATAVGTASDLYALGVIAYEALTGRRPFTAETGEEYGELHRNAPVPSLGEGFSPGLDRLFQRALAKRPEDRWGSGLEFASALRSEMKTRMRAQVRNAARQWHDRGRPYELLWRGAVLADLERWMRRSDAKPLSEVETEFVGASQRHESALVEARRRRTARVRRWLVALTAATVLAAIQYRAYLHTRMAEQVAELSVTQAEVEQGRQALLHGESEEAQLHLEQAYVRGDRSPGVTFMLARALQPRMAERARLTSSVGRMWHALFSPDGRHIVTTDDAAARVWDAQSHRLLLTLVHGEPVYRAVFTPDGTRLVTASADSTVKIWNAATGALLRDLQYQPREGKRTEYFVVALSPDGNLVAAIDMAGEVAHVWDASTGTPLAELRNDGSDFASLAFSADGRWLATSGGDEVLIFDTTTWKRQVVLAARRVLSLAFDPSGPRIATGTFDGDASIWEVPSGARLRHLRQIGEPIDALAFSPDGELFVAASRDGAEQVWNAKSGRIQSQFNHHRGKIQSIEFDPSSKLVVAAAASGVVAVSDAALGMPVAILEGPHNHVRVARFDPTSRLVVGASWDGTARVWDATSPYRRWSSPPTSHHCGIASSLEPDRRFLAIGCRNQPTRIWDSARDQLLAELPSATRGDGDFGDAWPAVSAAGDRAAIPRDSTVEIYALPGGQRVGTVVHRAPVNAVAFGPDSRLVSGSLDGAVLLTPDGRDSIALPMAPAGIDAVAILADGRVVAADAHQRLRIYDANHSVVLADLKAPTRVLLLRASDDGRRLITVPSYTKPAAPALWDLAHYRLVAQLEGHLGQVRSARFIHGGREILTAGGDGTARLWDGATGQLRQTYRGSSRFLADATIDPTGAMVVAGGGDGLLRFWDTTTGRPLWTLPAHKSYVVGIHFEGSDIVTRGFGGEVARWTLQKPHTVIEQCAAKESRSR